MSALPPKADITAALTNVRFVPKADISELNSITRLALVTIRNSRVGTDLEGGRCTRKTGADRKFDVPAPYRGAFIKVWLDLAGMGAEIIVCAP
jgi:hypothetical protein